MNTPTYLVCNAHIDIAWLWSWEEGAVEALSTFRTAVRLCKEQEHYIFNHNEAILYQWILQFDPALFMEIKALVKAGRWHIMGGWYLQPDCNLPQGESFVRQILAGRAFFWEHFKKAPTTATNFDPFGHNRGLVQILTKSGFDSYIACRPGQEDFPLEADDFIWVGFDGSEVLVSRTQNGYSSGRGRIRERVEKYYTDNPGRDPGLLLWGVGNHGGGPSKADLYTLSAMMSEGHLLTHTTPKGYFNALRASGKPLCRVERSMNHWGVGCYTSHIRIKQQHRRLESEYYSTEKTATHLAMLGLYPYPKKELEEALHDLLLLQFHDTLPGTSIQRAEGDALRLAAHGLEILSRLKLALYFAMLTNEGIPAPEGASKQPAAPYRTPIYLYNPHPYPVTDIFEYELSLAETMREGFAKPVLLHESKPILVQRENEENCVPIQWRRRISFSMTLPPAALSKLEFYVEQAACQEKPLDMLCCEAERYRFDNGAMQFTISQKTGLVEDYVVAGVHYLQAGSFCPLVMQNEQDSWGMSVQSYHIPAGAFALNRHQSGAPVLSVIEDGPVRTVIEGVFSYGQSTLVLRYFLPKAGTQVRVQVTLRFAETLKVVKLGIYTPFKEGTYLGEAVYGVEELRQNLQETVAQCFTAMTDGRHLLSLVNNAQYGSSAHEGAFYPTLIASCAYAAHPMQGREHVPTDRYVENSEHVNVTYDFYLEGGPHRERLARLGYDALIQHQRPYILNGFTTPRAVLSEPFMSIDNKSILCTAAKPPETGAGLVLRLFNSTGSPQEATVSLSMQNVSQKLAFGPFMVKTLLLREGSGRLIETDLLESPLEQ